MYNLFIDNNNLRTLFFFYLRFQTKVCFKKIINIYFSKLFSKIVLKTLATQTQRVKVAL